MIKYHHLYLLLASLTLNSQSALAANCPPSSGNVSNISTCVVEGNASSIQLNFISGFDSTTTTTAQGGNNGTTIGEQRRLAFIKAAETIADQVVTSQVIKVDATFSDLECDANAAVLGSAGAVANYAYEDTIHLPLGVLPDTFYPVALLNALVGDDVDTNNADIEAEFNSNLGSFNCLSGSYWYYGYDTPPAIEVSFTSVLLHELTHGLGFASMVNPITGEKTEVNGNNGIEYLDDIFSTFLYSLKDERTWSDPFMSDFDRRMSAKSEDGLAWAGGNVNSNAIGVLSQGFADNDGDALFSPGDCALMYAPNPIEGGSSISHFDTSAAPNELMEPNDTGDTDNLGLAFHLLQDIGWSTLPSSTAFIKNTGCGAYPHNSVLSQSDSNTLDITINGISDDFTYELRDTNGALVSPQPSKNINTLSFPYPASGEFAGTYTLTINGGEISIDIIRPLRLIWSATNFMDNHSRQTLIIEGGESGSTYTLEQNPVQVLDVYVNNTQQDTAIAKTDTAAFNPAIFEIESNNQTEITPLNVIISSGGKYNSVTLNNASAYPSRLYNVQINDINNNPIPNAVLSLSRYSLLESMNLNLDHTADENGLVTLYLPDAGFPISAFARSSGYGSEHVVLSTDNTNQVVNLTTNNVVQDTPKFGSGGGGSIPIWLLVLVFSLLLKRQRHLRD